MSSASVIIVGAGIAGCASGAKLLENGINNVILLEAENRIGGRIHTMSFGENKIDLGAQWCHGMEKNIVYEMVGCEGVLSETDVDIRRTTFVRSDGVSLDEECCARLYNLCKLILQDPAEELASYQGSVGDFLVQKYSDAIMKPEFDQVDSELSAQVLEFFLKTECSYSAADSMFDVSGYGFSKFKECSGPPRLNWKDQGFKTVFDFVTKKRPHASQFLNVEEKILINKEVCNINWSRSADESVNVKCSDGSEYNASHVIVSVSLGVLKRNSATLFTPPLPKIKRNAIEGISFGTVGKIFLEFEKPWWPSEWVGLSLLWTKQDNDEIKSTENHWLESIFGFYSVDYQPNVLLGRIYGPKVFTMEQLDDETIINGCMFIFEKFLSNLMNFTRPINVQTTRWGTNKHFLGSYSFHSNTTDLLKTSAEDLAHPIYDPLGKPCVLFAGEATASDFFSTVHGAIESGYREARRILSFYGAKED